MISCNCASRIPYFKEIEETCYHLYQRFLEIFRRLFPVSPEITIESYEDYRKHPCSRPGHLELGASNYGSNYTYLGPRYKTTSSHRLDFLYTVSAYAISDLKENCLLFLNDISGPGLDEAAEWLKDRLRENMQTGALASVDVKIVKIARNILTFDGWPKVKTAHFCNPFDFPTQRLVYDAEDLVAQQMAKALSRVVRASQTGLYISDINWKPELPGDKKTLQKKLREGCVIPMPEGMFLHPRRIETLSSRAYIYPNGDLKGDAPLCYQLTVHR